MKKTMNIMALALLISGTFLTGCQSSASKVENANEKVDDAKNEVVIAQQELDQAVKDSIKQYKKESEERIIVYEKNIAEFKVRIAKENGKNRAINERKLAELEQQNRIMKQQLADFNEERKDQWASFRDKFDRDMEKQGKAFRDFWGIRK